MSKNMPLLRIKRSSVVFTTVLLLSACASNGNSDQANPDQKPVNQTRVALLDNCLVAPQKAGIEAFIPGGIAGALIPSLIDTGVDFAGDALAEAAKAETKYFIGHTQSEFYRAMLGAQSGRTEKYGLNHRPENGCLIVVHGNFSNNSNTPEYSASKNCKADVRDSLNSIFGLNSDPKFYYEGKLDYAKDGSAFRVQTVFMDYRQTLKDGKIDAPHWTSY
jgi:hypothetical protein